jgi:hypothetical protein
MRFPEAGQAFCDLIPTVTDQVVIEGASHFLHEDKGERIAQEVLNFLGQWQPVQRPRVPVEFLTDEQAAGKEAEGTRSVCGWSMTRSARLFNNRRGEGDDSSDEHGELYW